MDCGDAGHILLSRHVAEDLEQYPHWRPYLHELGECEIKHGTRIGVVNFYSDHVGNAQLPKKFQALKNRRAGVRWAAITTAFLALAAIVAGITMFSRTRGPSTLASEKSIAVLPFENQNRDPDADYLCDGIPESIINSLSGRHGAVVRLIDKLLDCFMISIQFAHITFAEAAPFRWIMAELLSPSGARRNFLEPEINPGRTLGYASGPKPVHQHTKSVG